MTNDLESIVITEDSFESDLIESFKEKFRSELSDTQAEHYLSFAKEYMHLDNIDVKKLNFVNSKSRESKQTYLCQVHDVMLLYSYVVGDTDIVAGKNGEKGLSWVDITSIEDLKYLGPKSRNSKADGRLSGVFNRLANRASYYEDISGVRRIFTMIGMNDYVKERFGQEISYGMILEDKPSKVN